MSTALPSVHRHASHVRRNVDQENRSSKKPDRQPWLPKPSCSYHVKRCEVVAQGLTSGRNRSGLSTSALERNFCRLSSTGTTASTRHRLGFAVCFMALSGLSVLCSSWMLPHIGAPSRGLDVSASSSSVQTHAEPARSGSSGILISVIANVAAPSPFGVTWGEVLVHTAQRLQWSNSSFVLRIHDVAEVEGSAASMRQLAEDLVGSQITVLVGVQDPAVSAALADLLKDEPTVLALGSSPTLDSVTRLGGRSYKPGQETSLWNAVFSLFGEASAKQDAQVYSTVTELFERNTSDDFLFVFLVLINQYVQEVPLVSNSTKSQKAGLPELQCMISNCGAQIFSCYADTSCRTALNCLNQCHFNDQVCSYRCIASYESPQLADFSLCVLQKHNCLGLSADIPQEPDPAPLASFNGKPMTHELAEDLFIGWLSDPSTQLVQDPGKQEVFSWRVFSGKNPAYDYFPCQFQLFYRGKAQRSMWYDPVFKVQTLDEKLVWRRRHYRVRRGSVPGTFNLSVLDNGVTSKEFWRVLDCAEDLEWCAFYYSGAAAAAGTSYSGAILASKSGQWPDASHLPRIEKAMESAGIKMWELSSVDNSMCSDAPLDPQLMAMA